MERFGEKLKALRKQHNLSQMAIGKILEVDYSYIGKMERGENIPNATMLLKIAGYFQVSLDQLMWDHLELD
ncbi:helix-turn-helix transcriptional regulator [Anaerolineales bacterium HSG6]|nr:helix-turn-helix transcriptional regulator [Anaerolineales bacterium HSG6]MDM8530148.1 helix-turn-helix transcriptional regulator [Anaerolineales bacterium HSG25]